VNKTKRQPHCPFNKDKQPPTQNVTLKDSHGFLKNLVHAQAARKQSATSNSSTRKLGLSKSVSGGRNAVAVMGPQQPTINLPVNRPLDVDNKMAVEADPDPFKAAAPEKLQSFVPVLMVPVPEAGDANVVTVELSPVDLCHREMLQLDRHSMTHLSLVQSFNEMRQHGHSFQFCSAKEDLCPPLLLSCVGQPTKPLQR
jgi:hypothetical protein